MELRCPKIFCAPQISFSSAHVFALLDFSLPFVVEIDASTLGIGAVLM